MFLNYGDVDFFEYGVLVDAEHSDTEFHILYCVPFDDEEDMFLFADCTVDINDRWIDKEAVIKYLGCENNAIDLAIGCISYYGVENFSSPYDGYTFTREEIEEKLKHYLIANDNLKL